MDVENEYVPLPWQSKAHQEDWTHAAVVGGKGCLRESTEVWTSQGLRAIADLQGPQVYPSFYKGKFQLSLGTGSFPKGKANLYRVIHDQGEYTAAGHHHVLSYPHKRGFVSVADLQPGHVLLMKTPEAFSSLLQTNKELSPKSYSSNVLHLMKRLEDFLGRCVAYNHQYDPQLLLALGFSQDVVLQQVGVQGFSPSPSLASISHKGDYMGPGLGHSQTYQSFCRPSKTYSSLLDTGLLKDAANYILTKPAEYISLVFQLISQCPRSDVFHHIKTLLVQAVREYTLRLGVSWRGYTTTATIRSIERIPYEEWYWDLQVRDTNNYVTKDGTIHHNSAKTTFCIEELKACAFEYSGTLWVVARKTVPSLKDSTWKQFMGRLPDSLIKNYNKADRVVDLINGSQIVGRPLDEPKKFDSMEIAGFLIDEADEIEQEVYDTLKSRIRQKFKVGHEWKFPRYRSMLSLNPTDEDHWIPRLFLNNPPPDHKIYFSNTMENQANLPPGYIEQLRSIYHSPDMQQRMIYGMFGRVHKGRPVFPQFRKGNHIHDRLTHDQKSIIWRGWDFGYNNPACVWLQFINGQARVLAELQGSKIYLDDFIGQALDYQKQIFGEHDLWKDVCDPHGADEKDTGKTSLDTMHEHGIFPVYKKTTIADGIKAIKDLLDTRAVNSLDPNFIIHPRCKRLIEAMRGGYHRADGEDHPEKDGYFDHLMDAMRYVLIHLMRAHRFNKAASHLERTQNVFIHPVTGRRIEL